MHHKIAIPLLFQIAFNLMPAYGVMAGHWTLFSVIYLYWVETLIISFFSFIKIVTAKGTTPINTLKIKLSVGSDFKWKLGIKYLLMRIGTLLFYLLFIVVFVGFLASAKGQGMDNLKLVLLMNPVFNLTLLLYTLSLGMDMAWHYFGNGAYLHTHPSDNASFFDGRTIVMHVVIVLGALGYNFVKEKFPDNQELAQLYFIMIFVLVKTIADVIMYYAGRKNVPSNV